jgi:dihydrofolate synthase/folylpolyglutamate synthase
MKKNEYDNCLKSMFNLRRFGIKLGLSTMKHILKKLNNPQNEFKSIHIAGTNGKGSVASNLASILRKIGYKVGLYTSPHLIKFNERISINGKPISDKSITNLYNIIKSIKFKKREITFFEFTTAMAFYEFKRKKVDFAIIETGMGGKQDATNIIKPILSIITNISIEHKSYLGNTIKKITKEKAGIIKEKVPIITGIKQKEGLEVIKNKIKNTKSELLIKNKDFRVRKKNNNFNYFGKYYKWENMQTNLLGNFQIDNAAMTLAACELLNKKYINIPIHCIKSGLSENKWPGRIEIVLKKPKVILDGAHNLIAARNLAKFMLKNQGLKKTTLVVGILNDKPYKNMIKDLAKSCTHIIVTQPKIERSINIKKIENIAKLYHKNVKAISDVKKATIYAIKNSKIDDIIYIAGSLYVVGEAKKIFTKDQDIN